MGLKIQGVTIELGGDTSPLVAAFKNVDKAVQGTQRELYNIEKALKLDPTNIEMLAQKQTVLQQQAELTKTKMEQLNAIIENLGEQRAQGVQGLDEQLRAVERVAVQTAARLRDTETALDAVGEQMQSAGQQTAELSEGMAEAGNAVAGLNAGLESAGAQAANFQSRLAQVSSEVNNLDDKLKGKLTKSIEAFGVAAAAGAGVAIKKFVDFSEEMVKVKTLLDKNVMEYDDAQEMVKQISRDTGIAAGDVANAAYQALSAGVKTEKLKTFMETAAKTSVSGFTDMETAVNVLTTAMSSYGISVDEVSVISDKLITTQDKGKLTVGELAASMGNVVGTASNVGASLNEVLSATAALTMNGLSASSSLTSIKAAIGGILRPTADAAKLAQELGINFSAQALEAQGLSGMLAEVQQKTGGNTEQMARLFGSQEALNAMMILTGKSADEFSKTMMSLEASTGRTDEAFQLISEDTGIQFNRAVNAMSVAMLDLGDTLSPIIEIITLFLLVLSEIDSKTLVVIGTLVMVAATILQIVKVIKSLSDVGGKVGEFFQGMDTGALKTTAIILAVVAALIALIALLNILLGKGGEIEGAFSSINNSVGNVQNSVNNAGRNVPRYATGTQFHRGGPAVITEYAPEQLTLPGGARMMMLPRGSRVENEAQLRHTAPAPATPTIINVNVDHLEDYENLMRVTNGARLSQRQGYVHT